MSIDELEVKTRHKKKLNTIREKEEGEDVNLLNGRENDRRSVEASIREFQTISGENERDARTARNGTQGVESVEGDSRGYDQGIRPLDATPFATDSGIDRSSNTSRKLELEQLTPEERADRERELARQRKQRQRDRDRETAALLDEDISSSIRGRGRDERDIQSHDDSTQASRFTLKNPLKYSKEKVKLFTSKEADLEKEHLSFIYAKGSGLLDDILEIIVKGHEPVSIWQLDAGEADMLAEMHLERAKTAIDAARSARILLALYDRIFTLELLVPRMFATGRHIKGQGGLSFR